MKKTCYIISAGECAGIVINKKENDCIIAVDGGYKYAMENHVVPDIVLGDFDSLGYIPDESNIILHKPEKDDTDTMLAVLKGIEDGYTDFEIWGGLGERLDHTLANLQVVTYISKMGCTARLIGKDLRIIAITNESILLPARESGVFSIFTFDEEAQNVSIRGGKYELENGTLRNDRALGISNEFVGRDVKIDVKDGTLLIFIYDKI